jgi:bifunctional UDP-N-acetylglucosamine pyrophosphorylase/glucosamine-1-phosphate N-acetyltransferase
MHNKDITMVIAAAGKGSRSGLSYPKCLFKIKGQSILSRILQASEFLPRRPVIIASPTGAEAINEELKANKIMNAMIILQKEANGMGDAIMQLSNIKDKLQDNILLAWGDLPFITSSTIKSLIQNFFDTKSDFSLVTSTSSDPYTMVLRNVNGEIEEIIESRELNNNNTKKKSAERDIGIFLFKRDLILSLLKEDLENKYGSISGEHGFLYLIKHLSSKGYRVNSVDTKLDIETVSFNSKHDLKGFM